MKKKDLVMNIIMRIEEVMKIKYQPKTKEEFKRIAKMVLDSILPSLTNAHGSGTTDRSQPPALKDQSSKYTSNQTSGLSNNTARSMLGPNSSPLD